MKALILVILVSVVSAQTFFNTDRRGYRTSSNFRRFNGNGANGGNGGTAGSALTQLKESSDSAAGGYAMQEQFRLPDGSSAGGSGPDSASGVPAEDDAAPDAPVDAADNAIADVPAAGDSSLPAADDSAGGDAAGDGLADPVEDDSAGGGVAPLPAVDDEPEKDPNDLTWLRNAIRGEPDTDYPILSEIPKTGFRCSEEQNAGYYGDPEARCQVFHICQKPDNRMDSFLCPNGTIFSQRNFVCVWWWQYDCSLTEKDYALNANLYAGGEDGGQSNAVDAAAGGAVYPASGVNAATDSDSGYESAGGVTTSPMDTDEDLSEVSPAAGGTDASPMDVAADGAVAPVADPLTDDPAGDGAADEVAAGGAGPTLDTAVTMTGKTNAASAAAVRRRLRGRTRGRFATRSARRSSRRRFPARSVRRGLRSRPRSASRRAGGRRSFRRPVRRSARRRSSPGRAARRSNVSRRSGTNRI